jgi:uncharacterized PurR-regulated membrane protein YhhQ (DUF165 family)
VRRVLGLAAAAGFVGAIVAANYVTTRYAADFVIGDNRPEQMGFGFAATAGTVFAGAAFLLRDTVRDHLGRVGVLAVIVVGALVSYLISDASVATASAAAVLISELADSLVYEPLRKRAWAAAVLVSNTVGAVVDTVLFLVIAGFFTWDAVPGQLVGKVAWATLVPLGIISAVKSARRA